MAFKFDLDSYRRKHSLRGAAIRRAKRRTEATVAEYFASRLRVYVPNRSGKLRQSIRRRGSSVRVGVKGNEGFPYVHWINQTHGKGMSTLNVKLKGRTKAQGGRGKKPYVSIDGKPIVVKGGRMRYGSLPLNWTWTGKVGFVKIARREAKERMRSVALRNTRSALIGKIVT